MRLAISLVLLAAMPAGAVSLPAFFIPNVGQADSSVLFMVETPEMRAGFTAGSAIFQLGRITLHERFVDANAQARIEGVEPLSAHANFLIGNRPRDWKTNLPVYQKILYRNLYTGIDMNYAGAGQSLKSEFRVAPGANPDEIRLDYSDAMLAIASNGDLVVHLENADVKETAPVIYQETSSGGRVEIAGRYILLDAHTVGFQIDAFDRSLPLIIDPVLSYATYLGGTGMSAVTGVAVDSSGDLYVTGWTESLNFQIVAPIQASNAGDVDAFVAKLNPAGSALIYATYIGGSSDDQGAAIAVDSAGEAYVTGFTESTNFPIVAAMQPSLGGGSDAFALRLNALGSLLLYSTYLGGVSTDTGTAIAVDSLDNAYIAGKTQSANFPVLAAEQSTLAGTQNAFVTKLSSAGAKVFSTFLGGSGVDQAGGIALDSSDNVYVAGGTTSTNFPVKGAIQAVSGGGQDAFLTKLSAAGSAITYSTYLGGSGGGPSNPEEANAVAVDSSGDAYIAGTTNSTNFPVTTGAFQASFTATQDAFAAEVNPAGTALVYSTYLGGSAFSWANGIAVGTGGIAYVAGYTSSFDFPVVSPTQATFGGLYDAFVSIFNAAGTALSFSTFYGGSGSDEANAIAVDASGNMYLGGQTNSLNLTLVDPIQSSNGGYALGWLAKLAVASSPPPTPPAVVSLSPASGSGSTASFTAKFSDPGGYAVLSSVTLLVNLTASPNYGCQVTYLVSANQFALADDVASSGFALVNPGGGSVQNDQCTLNGSGTYVTESGNTLTVVISVSFQASFTGNDTVYLSAIDTSGNTTALVSSGIWTATVPPPDPTASSVSPNASTGTSQTFTFVFSDTQNALNITGMAMLFNTSLTFTSGCYIIVDTNEGTIALAYDNGTGSSSRPLSSSTPISNSQCTLGATTLTISGTSYILTVALTFTASFSGVKNIYMFGSESGLYETGWVQMGTYDVAVGGIPVASSVSPSSGTGPSQRFSFTVTDQGGASFLTGVSALISSSLSTTSACYVLFDRNANTISLADDNPANGVAAVTPGSTQVVSNSQCTLKASDSTVAIGVTSMVMTVDLTFNATYFGAKNVYLDAIEIGVTSGWVVVGGWTATGGAPEAVSVSPSSGAGATSSFVFTVSDTSSPLNISGMSMLFDFGSPANTANACYLVYTAGNTPSIGLYNNAGTTLSTKGIGSSATLSNSQCAVGYTAASTSGNSVVFSVNLSFPSSYVTAESVYLDALEPDASSGWVSVGSWTP